MELREFRNMLLELNIRATGQSFMCDSILDVAAVKAVNKYNAALGGDYILHYYTDVALPPKGLAVFVKNKSKDDIRNIAVGLADTVSANCSGDVIKYVSDVDEGTIVTLGEEGDDTCWKRVAVFYDDDVEVTNMKATIGKEEIAFKCQELHSVVADYLTDLVTDRAGDWLETAYCVYLLTRRNLLDLEQVAKHMHKYIDDLHVLYPFVEVPDFSNNALIELHVHYPFIELPESDDIGTIDEHAAYTAFNCVCSLLDKILCIWDNKIIGDLNASESSILRDADWCVTHRTPIMGYLAFRLHGYNVEGRPSVGLLTDFNHEIQNTSNIYERKRHKALSIDECTTIDGVKSLVLPTVESLIINEYFTEYFSPEQKRCVLLQYIKNTDSFFKLFDCAAMYNVSTHKLIEWICTACQ